MADATIVWQIDEQKRQHLGFLVRWFVIENSPKCAHPFDCLPCLIACPTLTRFALRQPERLLAHSMEEGLRQEHLFTFRQDLRFG
jgi:hypothetical protein